MSRRKMRYITRAISSVEGALVSVEDWSTKGTLHLVLDYIRAGKYRRAISELENLLYFYDLPAMARSYIRDAIDYLKEVVR